MQDISEHVLSLLINPNLQAPAKAFEINSSILPHFLSQCKKISLIIAFLFQ